ncbi:hypothetical protein [Cytobacillus sp. FSL K6-0265]
MKKEYYKFALSLIFLFGVIAIGILLQVYDVPMKGIPALFE